jgi:hypothetical protein
MVASIRQMISQSNTWRDIAASPANASAVRRKVSAAAAAPAEER